MSEWTNEWAEGLKRRMRVLRKPSNTYNAIARAADVSETTVRNAAKQRVDEETVIRIERGLSKLEAETAAVAAVRASEELAGYVTRAEFDDLRLLVERTQEQLRETLEAIVLLRRRRQRGAGGGARSSQ